MVHWLICIRRGLPRIGVDGEIDPRVKVPFSMHVACLSTGCVCGGCVEYTCVYGCCDSYVSVCVSVCACVCVSVIMFVCVHVYLRGEFNCPYSLLPKD